MCAVDADGDMDDGPARACSASCPRHSEPECDPLDALMHALDQPLAEAEARAAVRRLTATLAPRPLVKLLQAGLAGQQLLVVEEAAAAGACAATTDQELEQSLEGVSAWLPEATHGDLVRRAAIRYAINGEPIVDQALARRGAGRLEEFVRTLARDRGDGLGSSGGLSLIHI